MQLITDKSNTLHDSRRKGRLKKKKKRLNDLNRKLKNDFTQKRFNETVLFHLKFVRFKKRYTV